jgi:hypothetical protein
MQTSSNVPSNVTPTTEQSTITTATATSVQRQSRRRRPLCTPACCSTLIAIFGVLYLLMAAAIIAVYIMMRGLTTSTEKFEAVPCYIVAVQVNYDSFINIYYIL